MQPKLSQCVGRFVLYTSSHVYYVCCIAVVWRFPKLRSEFRREVLNQLHLMRLCWPRRAETFDKSFRHVCALHAICYGRY